MAHWADAARHAEDDAAGATLTSAVVLLVLRALLALLFVAAVNAVTAVTTATLILMKLMSPHLLNTMQVEGAMGYEQVKAKVDAEGPTVLFQVAPYVTHVTYVTYVTRVST